MLAATPIPTRPAAIGFCSRFFDLLICDMALEFPNISFRCCTSWPQLAVFAYLGLAQKRVEAPIDVVPSVQPLTGRTDVGFGFCVILKITLLKHPPLGPGLLQAGTEILHVGPNLALLAI